MQKGYENLMILLTLVYILYMFHCILRQMRVFQHQFHPMHVILGFLQGRNFSLSLSHNGILFNIGKQCHKRSTCRVKQHQLSVPHSRDGEGGAGDGEGGEGDGGEGEGEGGFGLGGFGDGDGGDGLGGDGEGGDGGDGLGGVGEAAKTNGVTGIDD